MLTAIPPDQRGNSCLRQANPPGSSHKYCRRATPRGRGREGGRKEEREGESETESYREREYVNREKIQRQKFHTRGGGLGSSTIFKNLMSPTPRRKWYLTTGRRAH